MGWRPVNIPQLDGADEGEDERRTEDAAEEEIKEASDGDDQDHDYAPAFSESPPQPSMDDAMKLMYEFYETMEKMTKGFEKMNEESKTNCLY